MGLFNWFYSWVCRRVFNRVDRDNSGTIHDLEVELAILHLYNIFNKRLPGWEDPPSRELIQQKFQEFDVDGNGHLDEKEFEEFARTIIKAGPDMFFTRVGKDTALKAAVVPGATMVLQRALALHPTFAPVANAPLHFLAPVVGIVLGTIKGLLPV